jgi:AcrR family transcriptional regulator
MPRSSRSRSLTREEVVAAALRLIHERGLSGLTMRAVSAELGVTPMATYYYIEDKDDLLRLVAEEVIASCVPLRLGEDGWEASLRRYLMSTWQSLARYPGLGAYLIEQPMLGVTPERMRDGIRFFEDAGFSPTNARLAWSFALTYIHGRISVDARLAHQPEAPRLDGLRAHHYVEFGVESVIHGLRAICQPEDGAGARGSWSEEASAGPRR